MPANAPPCCQRRSACQALRERRGAALLNARSTLRCLCRAPRHMTLAEPPRRACLGRVVRTLTCSLGRAAGPAAGRAWRGCGQAARWSARRWARTRPARCPSRRAPACSSGCPSWDAGRSGPGCCCSCLACRGAARAPNPLPTAAGLALHAAAARGGLHGLPRPCQWEAGRHSRAWLELRRTVLTVSACVSSPASPCLCWALRPASPGALRAGDDGSSHAHMHALQ